MSIGRLHIQYFLLQAKQNLIIDVRSPAEYRHAHIPGAVNIPLFTDEERKLVGTAYKQQSRQEAIKIGLEYFGPKMRKIVEAVEELQSQKSETKSQNSFPALLDEDNTNNEHLSTNIFIYCWRGGMRSAAVAWLLDLYGFKVQILSGGYKSFRNYVLKTFEYSFSFQLVSGFTGSGKTEILKELRNKGEQIIDLEEIACHKGSAFGNINMPEQPSQEMFENILAQQLNEFLQNEEKIIWLEDESQRLGSLNIPTALWNTMRISPLFFIDIPFEERLHHLTEEYGNLNREKMVNAILRITKRLGSLETKKAIEFLIEDNIHECFRILLLYYDKHYLKSLHNREGLSSLLTKISCNKVSTENASLLPVNHQPV